MKQIWLNFICLSVLLFCGSLMFGIKYYTIVEIEKMTDLKNEITQLNRDIHTLKAEWAYLTNPERLRQLIYYQTNLKQITPEQIKKIDEISKGVDGE